MLKVKELSKKYGAGRSAAYALSDVSFELESGSALAITGASGSGKSTLLHLIAGLDSISSGQISWGSKQLDAMDEDGLADFRARRIGMVFQAFYVKNSDTLLENVALAARITGLGQSNERAYTALESVNLSDRAFDLVGSLSGGEKQRVAIARALVTNPRVIIADEPTGNLDSVASRDILKILMDLNQVDGKTLILVTHDLKLAGKFANRLELKDGKIEVISGPGIARVKNEHADE